MGCFLKADTDDTFWEKIEFYSHFPKMPDLKWQILFFVRLIVSIICVLIIR